MRILFLATHLNAGGITSYLLTLSKGFIEAGHEVHICSSGGDNQGMFEEEGVHLFQLDLATKCSLSLKLFCAIKPICKYIKKFNIDVIHSQTRVTQVLGEMVSSQSKRPLVTTCHGFFKPKSFRSLFPCWGKKVIAISPAVEKHLKEDFHVKAEEIALVQSGIDISDYLGLSPRAHKEERGEECFWIGIVARLSDVKGQDILVEAIRDIVHYVSKVKVVIAGEGKLAPLLRKMVSDYELEDVVEFFPVFSCTADILEMLDVFVMPSRQEGLGLSILEAQAASLPVVASNVGGIPSLIEDGKTGFLVEPENSKRLAKILVGVWGMEDKGRSVGLAAREFVKEARFLENMISGTLKVYREVVK